MKDFRITFLALSRSTDIEVKSESEIDEIINDFILIFAKNIDYENYKINIEALQKIPQSLEAKLTL